MKFEVVWFKRDLRIQDNEALHLASQSQNAIIPIYIIEPQLWIQPDLSKRQYEFLLECLSDLDAELKKIGQNLIIKVGDVCEILAEINQKFPINNLYSHQETWNNWTFERDKKVKKWCKNNAINWIEPRQYGVIRRLKDRNGWAKSWQEFMNKKTFAKPVKFTKVVLSSDKIPSSKDLKLAEDFCTTRLKGGRSRAVKLLHSFLYKRGENYSKEMSSPLTATRSCSLLSAYISFGCISIREIVKEVNKRKIEIQKSPKNAQGNWQIALRSFSKRLYWHCHFIQKLEDEPRIEFENMHSAYNSIRNEVNLEFFEAWKNGKTGFPLIDAAMRCLITTGWINFRMRAMLVSFASYHLWLPWQLSATYLAKLFIDYEPGIHFSQVQMQSATTGINAIRIYNPIKQAIDQDPDAIFIKKWLPELSLVEPEFIFEPWKSKNVAANYPQCIVDEKTAREAAKEKIYALRKNLSHNNEANKILIKHSSRRKNQKSKKTTKKDKSNSLNSFQGDLFLSN